LKELGKKTVVINYNPVCDFYMQSMIIP
jgi:hypothetical protein